MNNSSKKLKNIFKELHISTSINSIKSQDIKIENSLNSNNPIVVKGLSAIILQGVKLKASDIHIEPLQKKTRVRYRIDGILYTKESFDISLHTSFISRLKIISHLDITEHKTPQDGKFKFQIEDKTIDFRVSIVPLITGEKAVIRILNKEIVNFELEHLGFSSSEYNKILKLIYRQNGIILSSGPTGSGKTSLIYSILKKLNNPSVNISTVEDPVEYEIEGINQVQFIKNSLDFSTILKSYLRQDPDILMIGEIRDYETAEIAVKAALTGHLVLSTIHTNDSISGIYRLLNIGIKPYMISASVTGIIAQRLLRKLCPKCKILDPLWEGKLSFLGINPSDLKDDKFYTKKGCEFCNNSGYIGRIPIFEILILDDYIKTMIDKKENTQEIKNYCKMQNMRTLLEIAIEKAKNGITSLDEIIRQC